MSEKRPSRDRIKLPQGQAPEWTAEASTHLFNILARALLKGAVPDLERETVREMGRPFWDRRAGMGPQAMDELTRLVELPEPIPGRVQRERDRCAEICRSIASMSRSQMKAAIEADAREYHRHGMDIAELCATLIVQEGREVDEDRRVETVRGAEGAYTGAREAHVRARADAAAGVQHVRRGAS